MAFLTEPEPERGVAQPVMAGILRIVADNPGKMTCHGTNTYLIPDGAGFIVLDPGPEVDPAHLAAILKATGGKISALLLTHDHIDHSGMVPDLRAASPAPLHAFHQQIQTRYGVDAPLRDGDRLGPLTALHTPGHAPDHLCFTHDGGPLFSGDHVMGWSSSVVSPPHGDMAEYCASLQRMIDRDDPAYLPGHGPAIPQPRAYVEDLLRRRTDREAEILALVRHAPIGIEAIRDKLYHKTDPLLIAAAARNVQAHLLKLQSEGRVARKGDLWSASEPLQVKSG